jgi:hypothetical protein
MKTRSDPPPNPLECGDVEIARRADQPLRDIRTNIFHACRIGALGERRPQLSG